MIDPPRGGVAAAVDVFGMTLAYSVPSQPAPVPKVPLMLDMPHRHPPDHSFAIPIH
jgi:hypothetical protein